MNHKSVIFDTNAYSRLMQGDEVAIRVANDAKKIYLCSIVVGELEAGFRGGSRYDQNKADLREFMADPKVECIYSTEKTSELYGVLMAALRKNGTKIPTNDVWIGAFAKERDLSVFTYDHHMKAMSSMDVKVIDEEIKTISG